MQKSIFIALLFIISGSVFGQKNLYLGLEAGIGFDKYEWSDMGDQLRSVPLIGGSFGFNVGYNINEYFSVETGAILKEYQKGYAFSLIGSRTSFASGGISSVQIPFRFNARVPLIKDRLFFTSVVGYHHCYNLSNSTGSGSIGSSGGEHSLFAEEQFSGNLARNFSLLETGIGLELRIFRNTYLKFSASYFTGFKKVAQSDVVYSVDKGTETRATLYSKGDYASYNMGLRFPIGTIGKRKK